MLSIHGYDFRQGLVVVADGQLLQRRRSSQSASSHRIMKSSDHRNWLVASDPIICLSAMHDNRVAGNATYWEKLALCHLQLRYRKPMPTSWDCLLIKWETCTLSSMLNLLLDSSKGLSFSAFWTGVIWYSVSSPGLKDENNSFKVVT